jgi:hypothetical protein
VKRTYKGKYYDIDHKGDEFQVSFSMVVEFNDKMSFKGSVWEDEFTKLSGKQLVVKGYIDEDHISFVKKYPCYYASDENGKRFIDESKLGHEVIYDGYWDENSRKWIGEWEVEGETTLEGLEGIQTDVYVGSFEMTMES